MTHYTAWLATSPECCYGDYCDVSITVDTLDGVKTGPDGEEIAVYTSSTETVLGKMTDVPCGPEPEGDLQAAVSAAEKILDDEGWEIIGEWTCCSEGFYATVEPVCNR